VSLILNYTDSTIKLREGKVVSIKASGAAEGIARAISGNPKPAHAAGAGEWTTDYDAALRLAKTDKKHVFVFFTGSDWCGWCMRLDKEILSTAEFRAFARERLVLVKLDYPRDLPQSAPLKARNQKLSEQYKVDGFPTIVILDSAGSSVGRMGYQPGGPQPFIKELKKL